MGVGAGQSLSWFCSAHNRSRLTWKFWKAVWGGRGWLCLPVGSRTLTEEAPGKCFIPIVLFCFVSFCSVVFLLYFIFCCFHVFALCFLLIFFLRLLSIV